MFRNLILVLPVLVLVWR